MRHFRWCRYRGSEGVVLLCSQPLKQVSVFLKLELGRNSVTPNPDAILEVRSHVTQRLPKPGLARKDQR